MSVERMMVISCDADFGAGGKCTKAIAGTQDSRSAIAFAEHWGWKFVRGISGCYCPDHHPIEDDVRYSPCTVEVLPVPEKAV